VSLRRKSTPCLSVEPDLLRTYREACAKHPELPALSDLLDATMREQLLAVGITVPPKPAPNPQTAKATAARLEARRRRDAGREALSPSDAPAEG
jgi:hypothetical protein